MAEIKVEGLSKEFGVGEDRVVALENVNMDVGGHVFVSIVGPSGCGKSTLLNILSGIETPSSGTVTITQDNHDAEPGYVFQAARLLPWRSVMDNLLFVQKDRSEETRAPLSEVSRHGPARRQGRQIPGGALRWHAAAGRHRPGLLHRARCPVHGRAVQPSRRHHRPLPASRAARDVVPAKKTVLFVTHDVGEAVELSNRILVFAEGGKLEDDLQIDLPFPRDPADEEVAVAKAQVLRKFEELDLIAS